MSDVEILLAPSDAALIAGIGPQGVTAAARAGRIPVAARTPRGNRLFRLRDIEEFARKRKVRQLVPNESATKKV